MLAGRPRVAAQPATNADGFAPAGTTNDAAPPIGLPPIWVAVLAVGSAIGAAVTNLAVFPYGSVNDDEAIYRLQARTLASGHLFPAAPTPARAFVPWLAAIVRHHYVLKYTPVEAAVLAASHLVTGSFIPALALTAAALVVVTWFLASELLSTKREALVATALVTCSPLVVIQSGLLLGYLTTLVLLEVFIWTLVHGVREEGSSARWWLVGSGLAFGVAAAIRPYDALIFTAPFFVWMGAHHGRRALDSLRWFILGGLGPLAAWLTYNDLATGSPLKLPFNLQEAHDTLGFGLRRLSPTEDFHHFGIVESLSGLGHHVVFLILWVAGGPIVVGLAVMAVRNGQLRGPSVAMATSTLSLLAGYLVFWGPWNAGTIWGGIRLVGPFYLLPLVVVGGVLAARGMTMLGRSRPGWVGPSLVVMAVFTVAVTAPVVAADARYSRQDGQMAALTRTVPGPALVILPAKPGFVMFPHWNLGNESMSGPVLFAAATGTAADFALLAQFANHIPYFMTFSGSFLPHRTHLGVQLNRLIEVRGPVIDLRAQASPAKLRNRHLTLTVNAGGRTRSCGRPDAAGRWALHIAANGDVTCTGSAGAVVASAGPVSSVKLKYSAQSHSKDEVDIPVEVKDGIVRLLLPGPIAALLRHVTLPLAVTPSG